MYKLIPEEGKIIVYNEAFSDGNTNIDNISDVATKSACFKSRVVNTLDTEQKLSAIIAVYDADNALKAVDIHNAAIQNNNGVTLSGSELFVNNVNFAKNDVVKVFFWDDFNNLNSIVTRNIILD